MSSRRASWRASDADRESVVERLRRAAAEGRIAVHELEERITLALKAKTYGDLDALVRDLPWPVQPLRGHRRLAMLRRYPWAAAVLGAVAALLVIAVTLVLISFGSLLILACSVFYLSGRRNRGRRVGGRGARLHVHAHRW